MESDTGFPVLFGADEKGCEEEREEEGEPPDVEEQLACFREQWKDELHSKTQTEQPTKEQLEKEAKKWFLMGSRMEQEGALNQAVVFYRRALHLVPDIEMRIEYPLRSPRDRQESESSIDSFDGNEMECDLVMKFENLNMQEEKLCYPQFQQMACHISALPVEVLIYIFKWVITSQLDMKSLENISQVCRGFYLCARDEELWRLACQRVWGNNKTKVTKFGSWRNMYIERPHVQFLGCYISKVTYFRPGERGMDNFYTPWHDVTYYRYIRFFAEGIVLMMSSPEDPQMSLPKLRSHKQKVSGMLKGVYKLSGKKVSAVLHRVKIPEKNVYYKTRRNKNQKNQNEQQQTFHLDLELTSIGKRNGAKLNWVNYSVRTFNRSSLEESVSEFDLDNKSYPPLIFSRVKSFAWDVDSPLEM